MTDQTPHDLDAERAVLGAILLKPASAVDTAARILTGDEFHSPRHANIYEAVLTLHAAGQTIDPVTVRDTLNRHGNADDQTLADLSALMADAPGTNPHRHAQIVADKHRLRQLIAAAGEIRTEATEGATPAADIIDRAEQAIYALTDRIRGDRGAVHFGESLTRWMDTIENRVDNDGPRGVPTGWIDLDRLLTGLRPGQLIIVAGRPGMGKSAFLGNLVTHAASQNHPALLVSAEMALEELQDRFVASEARVDLQHIRTGEITERDWPRLSHAMGVYADMPLYIQEAPGATVMSIRGEARRVAARARAISVIVVDYLQLLKPIGKHSNREGEVASLARGLKELALEMRVPVVAAAQLNRQLENRADKRPTLADLRESGELENAADVVMFPYRDEYYNAESKDAGICEVIVAKHRNGPLGTVKLTWVGQYGRLENMARA